MTKCLKIAISTMAFLAGCTLAIAQIGSNFNINTEGWTTPNDADGTISYSSTGGNPGGHVFGSPFVFVGGAGTFYFNFYFVAPSAFLGNRSAYYNGTLRYDIQQSSTGTPNQYAEVTIASNAGVVLYYFPPTSNQPPAPPSWATYSVALNNALGYWKTTNSVSGAAATEVQIQTILSDLASLQIRGLYRDANTTNRLDNVTFVPPIVITTQPTGSTVCDGAVTTMSTAATNNPSISYQWQRETSPSVWGDISNTGGYSGVTTNTLAINTTGNFGAGNYRCRISGTAANDVFTSSATVIINPLPSAPGTTGNSSCGPAAITLNASGGTAGQYRWYTVPTGGTAIAGQTNSSYTTPVISTTTNYYASINNGTCESSRTLVVATINTIPGAPATTGNSSCGPAAVTLNASGGTAGQYRWYTVPTGGTAIAGQTNSSYTTPVISVTTNYYVSINNGPCEGSRTLVVATINTIPGAPATTGNSSCGPAALTLNASGGSAGQYRWYTVPTGGTAIAGQTNSSYTTPVISTTTNYYVSINNGTCESSRTLVVATINTIPGAPATTGNSSCGPAAVTLNASGGSAGQYRWYTVPTGGTAIAGQTNSSYTTPVISTTTNYYVSINNGPCEGSRTLVVATINTIPGAPATTGNSSCGPAAVTLNASGGTAGQYRWYTAPTGGTAIAGQTNSSYTTPVISTTTNYYVSINNGTCESNRTLVVATINTIPGAPATTGNSSCGPAAVTLNASGGSAGQYRWYTVPTGGTAIAGQTNSSYTTPVISTTTNYYVSINNGTCESNRTLVVATINTIPGAPATTGNSSCGPAALTLNASGGSAGQYRWYTVPTGGTAIAGQTNSSYTTPVISTTTNYYVSINNGPCEGSRTLVVATINTIPGAPATTGNSSCGPAAITLNASGGSAGQYRWYTVPTGGTAIAGQTNSSYTTPVISVTTNYYVSINNGTCESNRTLVVATISSVPSAPTTTGNAACGAAAITLNASGGSAGQYRWYTAATGGAPLAGETNSSYTTPVLSTTTTYYVSVNNGCESTRTAVDATINPLPGNPSTVDNGACGSNSVTVTATGGTAGQYRWYSVATGGTAISGETSDSFTTPVISSTTIYYVSIDNGTCESSRSPVTAMINVIPSAPVAIGNNSCSPAAISLSASGGSAGQYRWYSVPTGGTAIAGQTGSTFTTPVISETTTYYVSLNDGMCESNRIPVVASIDGTGCSNQPPNIIASSTATSINGIASFDLLVLISDDDDNLDPSTLNIVTPPVSGAEAQINNGLLTINYSGLSFAGQDRLTIEVCDLLGSCTQQELTIDVEGDVNVYSGISPNGDKFNEVWIIQNIESLPETRDNKVSLYNRWGDLVFEITNYDNDTRVFKGLNNTGDEITAGVYFYRIEFSSGRKPIIGYLTVKK